MIAMGLINGSSGYTSSCCKLRKLETGDKIKCGSIEIDNPVEEESMVGRIISADVYDDDQEIRGEEER